MPHDDPGEAGSSGASGLTGLRRLIEQSEHVLVAAVGAGASLVPVPAELQIDPSLVFDGGTAVDVLVPGDQLLLASAWSRAQSEPIVRFDVHLRAAPDDSASLSIFDVRPEHGVHVIALETPHTAEVLALARQLAAEREGIAHVRRDATAVFVEIDAATSAMLGWTAEELIGRMSVELLHPDDLERAVESWMSMRAGGEPGRVRVRFRHRAGHYLWVEIANENRLEDPAHRDVVSEIVDISAEMAELEALQQREALLQRLADALPVGVCQLRLDGTVAYANVPFAELLGEVRDHEQLVAAVAGDDQGALAAAVAGALRGEPQDLEVSIVRGLEERRCHLALSPSRLDDGDLEGVVVCAGDVTEPARLRAELEHRASHDALSGCLNRAATLAAIERALREWSSVTVAYLDIDEFKSVNDALGHAAGDEILRVVTARLRGVIRSHDSLGRMGGDEFVVVFPQRESSLPIEELVARLKAAVSGPITFANQRVAVSASIGAVSSVVGADDADALLQRADAEMYRDKRARRSRLAGGPVSSPLR